MLSTNLIRFFYNFFFLPILIHHRVERGSTSRDGSNWKVYTHNKHALCFNAIVQHPLYIFNCGCVWIDIRCLTLKIHTNHPTLTASAITSQIRWMYYFLRKLRFRKVCRLLAVKCEISMAYLLRQIWLLFLIEPWTHLRGCAWQT